MGEFTRFWEVVASPAGANPMIDDQLGVEINLTVDREGAYTVRLTLTDNGCPGDLDGAFATAEHTVTFSSGPEGTGPFVRGDCNGDRIVSGVVTDAVFMLNFNFLGGAEPPCFAACDANRDGAFRGVVTDAVYILNFNFLGGPRPPEPFPACGASAEASDIALGCLEPIVCQ
jgi:hypothetical protein